MAEREVCAGLIDDVLQPGTALQHATLTRSVALVAIPEGAPPGDGDPLMRPEVSDSAIILDSARIARHAPEWRRRWDQEIRARMR